MKKMNLTPWQKEVATDNHRFRVLCCGRRAGKTTLAVEEIKAKAVYNNCRIAYISPTYQQSRDIAWQTLIAEMKPVIKKVNESRLELTVHTIKGGETIIQLRGWESIETLRGQKFDFVVLDEIAMMRNFWLQWQEVIRPTLTDTKGEGMFISTPKGFNHFYELYNLENTDSDYKSFHYTSYDNPYLPVEELDKAKEEIPEDRFAQEYLADFRKTEGLVYKEFSREVMVYENIPEGIQFKDVIVGVDFGWNHPAAVVKIGVDHDSNFWIDDEFYKREQTTERIAEAVGYFKPNTVYPDPAEPDRIDTLRQKGFNVAEVKKGKDSVKAGIDKINELLKAGRIRVNKRCTNTIWEFETYRYPDETEKRDLEVPIKENDDAMDAMRYALMTYIPTVSTIASVFEEQRVLQNRESKRSFK